MKKMYIQSTIDYIENNIEEPMDVDIISDHIGFSKYYLHRLFYTYTGMSIMEYVRKRKLEYSIQDLKTKAPIIDIAIKYGYNSQRSFSRAFTNIYGKSPSFFRNNSLDLSPKLSLNKIGGINMLPYLNQPKVVTLNELFVLSHQVISKEPEHDVIDFMMEYEKEHNLNVITNYGFDIPVSEEESKQGLRGYEYWIVLSEEDYNDFNGETVEKRIIPASKYLTLTIEDPFADPYERIPNGWKKLFSKFEENYNYNPELSCLEEKIEDDNKTTMDIFAPIK